MSDTFTFNAAVGDCYGNATDLDTGTGWLFLAQDGGGIDVRTWIPFVLPLPRYLVITSAVLKWTANDNRSETTVSVRIGCEDADNPSTPVDEPDIVGRVMTSAHLFTNLEAYTTGTLYSYTITTAVQEVLNRPGWASGNTLAVLVDNDGTTSNKRRLIASVEDTTYPQAVLEITVPTFFEGIIGAT